MKGTSMDFDKFDKEFDNHFKTVRRFAVVAWIVGVGTMFCAGAFAAWVVVKLLQHFAVI